MYVTQVDFWTAALLTLRCLPPEGRSSDVSFSFVCMRVHCLRYYYPRRTIDTVHTILSASVYFHYSVERFNDPQSLDHVYLYVLISPLKYPRLR